MNSPTAVLDRDAQQKRQSERERSRNFLFQQVLEKGGEKKLRKESCGNLPNHQTVV